MTPPTPTLDSAAKRGLKPWATERRSTADQAAPTRPVELEATQPLTNDDSVPALLLVAAVMLLVVCAAVILVALTDSWWALVVAVATILVTLYCVLKSIEMMLDNRTGRLGRR